MLLGTKCIASSNKDALLVVTKGFTTLGVSLGLSCLEQRPSGFLQAWLSVSLL